MKYSDYIEKYIILSYLIYQLKVKGRQYETHNSTIAGFLSTMIGGDIEQISINLHSRFVDNLSYYEKANQLSEYNIYDLKDELNLFASENENKKNGIFIIHLSNGGTGISFIDSILSFLGIKQFINTMTERDYSRMLNVAYLRSYENAIILSKLIEV